MNVFFRAIGAINRQAAVFDGVLWISVVLAGLGLAVLVAGYARRRLLNREDSAEQNLTLDAVRRLREAGKLSPSEFESIRAVVCNHRENR